MSTLKYAMLVLLFAYLGASFCAMVIILFLGGTFQAAVIAGFLLPFKLMGLF